MLRNAIMQLRFVFLPRNDKQQVSVAKIPLTTRQAPKKNGGLKLTA